MDRKTLIEQALGLPETSYDRLMRDTAVARELEKARKSILDYEESPSMQYVRKMLAEMEQDPVRLEAQRLMQEYTLRPANDPIHQQARTMMEEYQRRIEGDPDWRRLQTQLASAREQFFQQSLQADAELAYNKLLAVGVMPGGLSEIFGTVGASYNIEALTSQYSIAEQLGATARANQWSSVLGADISARLAASASGGIAAEVERVQRAAAALATSAGPASFELSASLGLAYHLDADMDATRLKLAALAGATDVLGVQAGTTWDAYGSVFGEWRTRADLPLRFWRDPAARRRMYRDAEVDEGLIESDVGTALEVVVESGLSSGFRAESGTVAIIPVGRLSMSVRSNDSRVDTYQALGTFEEEMRDFISRKLFERYGPRWFKQRVDGAIIARAEEIRVAAAKSGELAGPLIDFTELGHLITIVLSKANWAEVFEPVFVNRTRFEHDMQTLMAARRPTAHFRKIDGVRMVEAFCVIERLTNQMRNDGAWQRELDNDE